METLTAHGIVDSSIARVSENGEGQTVNTFTKKVEADVRKRTQELQEVMGDDAKAVVGPAMEEARSYSETKLQILNPDFIVQDTMSEGAAAWNDKGDNSISVATEAMEQVVDEGYWERTKLHEQVHQEKQAASFNVQEIEYVGADGNTETIEMTPLVEWQATQVNVDSDLTPDYKQHKKDGQAFADAVGEDKVVAALKDGDMRGLQQEIIRQQMEEQLQRDAEQQLAQAA